MIISDSEFHTDHTTPMIYQAAKTLFAHGKPPCCSTLP